MLCPIAHIWLCPTHLPERPHLCKQLAALLVFTSIWIDNDRDESLRGESVPLNRMTICWTWKHSLTGACRGVQAFINTARKIYEKIEQGVFDVSNEVQPS